MTAPMGQTPSVGRIVHYTAYNGTCLASMIIGVNDDGSVDLAVWTNLTVISTGRKNFGQQFHQEVAQDSSDSYLDAPVPSINIVPGYSVQRDPALPGDIQRTPGTWHWPERV